MLNAVGAGSRTRAVRNKALQVSETDEAAFRAENADTIKAMTELVKSLAAKQIESACDNRQTETLLVVSYQDPEPNTKTNRLLLLACQKAVWELMGLDYIVREMPTPASLFRAQISWHMHT